jgi:hypothetical protein
MPGGGSAAREPWRMAAGAMHLLGEGRRIAARFDRQPEAARLQNMLRRGTNCPATTSMERWIDAMVGLLGLNETMAFEGEAAMQLEGLATAYGPALAWPFGWEIDGALELDLLPLLDAMRKERTVSRAAAVFHASLVAALEDWVWRGADKGSCGGTQGLSAIYTFFDPDIPKRSLGTYCILTQIEQTHQLGLPYLYLGYWVKQCHKMSYKIGFRPLQLLLDGHWSALR